MYVAGTTFEPAEGLQFIQLTTEVMKEHFSQLSCLQPTSSSPRTRTEEQAGVMAGHAIFLQVGSIWIREMAIYNMSNWSLLNKLTTKLILATMALRKDDPITFKNCMGTLCLLSSAEEICGKIRGLGGVEKIMSLLPRQFPEEVGREISQTTRTQTNNHFRFTLRTSRHLTEPEINKPYYPRINTETNPREVLGALTGWGGDETTKDLALQVIHNMMRELDETSAQAPSPRYDGRGNTDPTRTKTRGEIMGPKITTRAQGQLYRLETETHAIERAIQTLYNHSSQHHITQSTGIKILQTLTPEGYFLSERTPLD